jgi:hypothetical protein
MCYGDYWLCAECGAVLPLYCYPITLRKRCSPEKITGETPQERAWRVSKLELGYCGRRTDVKEPSDSARPHKFALCVDCARRKSDVGMQTAEHSTLLELNSARATEHALKDQEKKAQLLKKKRESDQKTKRARREAAPEEYRRKAAETQRKRRQAKKDAASAATATKATTPSATVAHGKAAPDSILLPKAVPQVSRTTTLPRITAGPRGPNPITHSSSPAGGISGGSSGRAATHMNEKEQLKLIAQKLPRSQLLMPKDKSLGGAKQELAPKRGTEQSRKSPPARQ